MNCHKNTAEPLGTSSDSIHFSVIFGFTTQFHGAHSVNFQFGAIENVLRGVNSLTQGRGISLSL